MKPVNCFIVSANYEDTLQTVNSLKQSELINQIFLLVQQDTDFEIEGVNKINIQNLYSTETIKKIAEYSNAVYSLFYTKHTALELGQHAIERFYQIAKDTDAGLVYADYYQLTDKGRKEFPLIDYQAGSVRDDFNFGSVLFFKSDLVKQWSKNAVNYDYAGLYDLRLAISQKSHIIHINEYLYTEIELDQRASGEKQFDYVNPRNREVQIEMEKACTAYLKDIKAYLSPTFKSVEFDKQSFEYEASVIIPVKNRAKTIGDTIESVIKQRTDFPFNLIIIDNHSTDGTSDIIQKFKGRHSRIIHLIPERTDLGIGGCWNVGIESAYCGKFAIQLDSDDVYENHDTIQKIVDTFYRENCAMVIGSYTMTNFNMETIPPGLIDHKEWTEENGRNNALRINGLGAPRAFYTPLLREIKVPNVSYGEDYALGLRISREYRIGRIYDSIYLCRRWEDNSDASLDVEKMNRYNSYKDKIRTIEILSRQQLNKKA